MEESKIREMLKNFHNDPNVQKLLARYRRKSISEIYGVARRELSHSLFLAWLFDSQADHGLGALACNKLMIMLASHENRNYPILNPFLVGQQMLRNEVTTECAIDNGRPDIIIIDKDNNIRLIIECKVVAKETNDQTARYYKADGKEKDGHTNIYVYLTPNGADSPKCKEFIHINYQEIIDDILNPILKDENLSPRTKFIIDDYILALEKPAEEFEENNNNKNKKNIIMGEGKEYRELLEKFWNNNNKLIIECLQSLSESDDSEIATNASEALKVAERLGNTPKKKLQIKISNSNIIFEKYNAKDSLVDFVKYLYENYHDQLEDIPQKLGNRIFTSEQKSKDGSRITTTQIPQSPFFIKTWSSTEEKAKLAKDLAEHCGLKEGKDFTIELIDKG